MCGDICSLDFMFYHQVSNISIMMSLSQEMREDKNSGRQEKERIDDWPTHPIPVASTPGLCPGTEIA